MEDATVALRDAGETAAGCPTSAGLAARQLGTATTHYYYVPYATPAPTMASLFSSTDAERWHSHFARELGPI